MKRFAVAVLLILIPAVALGWTVTGSELNSSGWDHYTYSPSTITNNYSVALSGCSAPSVEFKIPAGVCGPSDCSGDPGAWYYYHAATQEIWLQYTFRYRSDYDAHPSGNKLVYLKNDANQAVFIIDGPLENGGTMRPIVGAAFGSYGSWLTPNLASTPIFYGSDYRIKFHWNMTSGLVEYWVNDVKNASYTGITTSALRATSLTSTQILPIWGGNNHAGPDRDNYIYFSGVTISNDIEPGGGTAPPAPVAIVPSAPTSLSLAAPASDAVRWTGASSSTSGRAFSSAEMASMKYYVRIDKSNPRDTAGSTGWNQSGRWYYIGEVTGATSWPANAQLSSLLVSYGFAGQAVRFTVTQVFNDSGVERESQMSNVATWTSDGTPPYLAAFSPVNGATGVPDNTTSFSFQYGDTGLYAKGANSSALSVACPGYGGTKSCSAGLTCSGTSALWTVTYPGLSLSADNVVACTITGADLESPPNTVTQTYGFKVRSASPAALSIDTTTLPDARVGSSYTAPLALSGGQPPYSCDNTGVLPTGIPLSSSCASVGPGVPTTAGTYNFTLLAEDAQGAADNQALSLTVLPAAPGGQFTLVVSDNTDSYINSGAPSTNYSAAERMHAYIWPAGTESNTMLPRGQTSGLPDNVSLVRVVYMAYLEGWEGAGIDNMVLYVRPTAGAVNPDNVTWTSFPGSGAVVSSTTVRLQPGWTEFDVTALARTAYADSKASYVVSIGSGTGGVQDQNRYFTSAQGSDASKRPYFVYTYMVLTPAGDSTPAKGKFRLGPGSSPKHFSCVEAQEPLQFSSAAWKIQKYGKRPEIWLEVEQ